MSPTKAAPDDTRSAFASEGVLMLRMGDHFWPASELDALEEQNRLDMVHRHDLAEQIRQARREVYG